ncbi:MAG TPA: ribosome maturation factor RimP [Polyangiaceae bacterium]|nr:ribosome maturation factor RimP [Polyangiaceae bacterium]
MPIAFTKLPGLDAARILAIVEPVLAAHHVHGVELIWRTDRSGMLLELSVEKPDSSEPGAGVTVDLCSEISRDLSAALDVAEVISQRYVLEVGSPGVERSLYGREDYVRFAGQLCKVKLVEPVSQEGSLRQQRVLRGTLRGIDEQDNVSLDSEQGPVVTPLGNISAANLVFDWNRAMQSGGRKKSAGENGKKARKS